MNHLKDHIRAPGWLVSEAPMETIICPDEEDYTFADETFFRQRLRIERMRTERSKTPFLLLLMDISKLLAGRTGPEVLAEISAFLIPSLRKSDILGWYHSHHTLGVIYTDLPMQEHAWTESMAHKACDRIFRMMDPEWLSQMTIACYRFPAISGAAAAKQSPLMSISGINDY